MVLQTKSPTAGSSRTTTTTTTPRTTTTTNPPGSTSLSIGQTSLALVDTSRVAVVDGKMGPRQLNTLVLYPELSASGDPPRPEGQLPLIVFAPGYLQCRSYYTHLLDAWVRAGFVVAAIRFPLTSCNVPGGPNESDIVNQPGDMSFVITQLLAASSQPSSVLYGLIDPSEIGVAGHSDGGDTVAALAASTCCRDPRVRAAVVLAGAELASYGGEWFGPGTPPMLFVQGSDDKVNDPSDSVALYDADTASPRYFLSLLGAGHFSPYEGSGPPEQVVAQTTAAFFDLYLKGEGSPALVASAGDVSGISVLSSAGQPPQLVGGE